MAEILAICFPNADCRRSSAEIRTAWWAVVSRFLLHGIIVSTWVSRIPTVQGNLGLSNAGLGFCLLGTAIGSIAGIPVASRLIARFGSKRVASWSTTGFAIALVAPGFAWNALTLFAALILFGAFAAANDVSINAQAVAVENARGSSSMSRFHAMFSIGGMAGAAVGSVIAATGIAPCIHLLTAGLLACAVAIATRSSLFEAGDHMVRTPAEKRLRAIPAGLIVLAVIGFCMFLSEGAMADWSGIYLSQVLNAGHGTAAVAYAVFSAGMAVCRLLGDWATDRLGPVLTIRAGAIVAAAALSWALLATTPAGALPGFALTGAGFAVVVPLAFAAGGRIDESAGGIAMVSGSGYLGFLVGPALIGFIAQKTDLRSALFGIVALSLLTALLAGAAQVKRTSTVSSSVAAGSSARFPNDELAVEPNFPRG